MRVAGPGRPGVSRASTSREHLGEFLLDQAAQPHGLQIILGRQVQTGFQAGDLRRVGKLIHLPAGDQRLENGRLFRR